MDTVTLTTSTGVDMFAMLAAVLWHAIRIGAALQVLPAIGGRTMPVRARLMKLAGSRLTLEGVILITAMRHRTQERNRADAIERLQAMVDEASIRPVYRVPTRPTKASKERRLKAKTTRASIKSGRGKPSLD